jgi:phosphodiesterase/alkaline phosphatase D-like protein
LSYQLPGNSASALTYAENAPSGAHDITIGGLTPGTTYEYRIVATTDDGGQTNSPGDTFTTTNPEPVGPAIGTVTATTGATVALLAFSTTPAATVQITYHPTNVTGQDVTVTDGTANTSHAVGLTGLVPNTEYAYRVIATSPNGGQTTGNPATFTTRDTPPPGPTITLQSILAQFGVAYFTLTTTPAATVQVVYGIAGQSASLAVYTDPAGAVTNHQFGVSPLQANTTYTYRIIATTPDGGITVTDPATFTTPGPR